MNRSRMLTLALAALLACGAPFTIAPAHAATFTVTRADDPPPNGCVPGDCSLREAIIEANANADADEITLPAGTYTLTIVGKNEDAAATGDLDITHDVTLTGAGAATTIIQAGTSTDNGIDRVFDVQGNGAKVSLTGITLRYGNTNGFGGGILNQGMLTLTNSTISGNTAGFGGGIGNGGNGKITVVNSTISGNTGGDGGGISNSGTASLASSTISGNTARFSGGGSSSIGAGGGIYTIRTLTLAASTISGNTASNGGGVYNGTGGTAALTNSTISGNNAQFSGGGIRNVSSLRLMNSTVAFNSADSDNDGFGFGGGINSTETNATTTLKNTLLSGNTRGTQATTTSDCFGTFISQGYNLIASTAGCTVTGDTTGNLTGSDPQLGPLADNGGPTFTQALLPNSPAVDAGDPAGCTDTQGQPLPTDQRGVARPQGAHCDIGAFELEMAAPPTPTPSPTPNPKPSPSPVPSPEPAPASINLFLPIMVK